MIGLAACRWSLLALILLQPIWHAWLAPPAVLPIALLLALLALPLLALLPGVWRLRTRPLVLAGWVLLLHFCIGVMELWANPAARWLALIQVVLVVIYFMALLAVRRQPRAAAG